MSHELNKILSIVFESSPIGIMVSDLSNTIIFSNAEADRIFGYNKGEIVGENIDVLILDKDKHSHKDIADKYVKNPHVRKMGSGLNIYGKRKDNSSVHVEISLSPFSSDGNHNTLIVLIDLTERDKKNALLEQEVLDKMRLVKEKIND